LVFPQLVRFSLFLALCLIVSSIVEEVAGPRPFRFPFDASRPAAGAEAAHDKELPINDLDDDPALPNFSTWVALIGLISPLTLPRLRLLSRRWPPPLRPPQFLFN